MGCGILSFLVPRCGNGGSSGCGNARAVEPAPFPADLPGFLAPPAAPPPSSGGGTLAGDAGLAPAMGEAGTIGLPGEAPVPRPVAALAAPEPLGGAAPAPAGGGFLDGLLRGVRDLFRPAPQAPGLRAADTAVADFGRKAGQVVDQVAAAGRGILDRVVGFLRGLFGDVDRLVQGFK